MKTEKNHQIESIAWIIATVLLITVMLSSCASSKTCHAKGHYVSKDIKRAQAKPRSY